MNSQQSRIVIVVTALLCILTFVQANAAAADDLLVYWNFDQVTQDMAKDLSGNGLDGKIGAGVVPSPAGKAAMMDGKSGSIISVKVPEDKRFGKQSWTFMTMVKPIKLSIESTQNQRRIFSFGKYPDSNMIIDIKADGQMSCYFCYKDAAGKTISTGGSSGLGVAENQWAHIALVCDRPNKSILMYVNGYPAGDNKISDDFDGDFTLDGLLTVGGAWQNYWGMVDEVKIFRNAVAGEDIEAEYERLKDRFDIVESDQITAAKKLARREKIFDEVNAQWSRRRYDQVRSLCRELVDDSEAPAHFRSYAHLRIAQSYLAEGNRLRARKTYQDIAENKSYPSVHRDEAKASIEELSYSSRSFTRRNTDSTRTEIPAISRFTAEVFLSPEGSDTNTGSRLSPFATLTRARDEVRTLKKRGIKGPIAVTVLPGKYMAGATLALTAEDSGTDTEPVVYRAAEKGTVVFYGGRQLSNFKPVTDSAILKRLPAEAQDKVMQCNLKALGIEDYGQLKVRGFAQPPSPPTLELFVDGKAMTLARWPNEGFVGIDKLIEPGSRSASEPSVFKYLSDRHARWTEASDGWLFGYFHFLWADATIKIGHIDPTAKTLTTAEPYNYGSRGMDTAQGIQYYAFNLLEEIDTPGEWYLQRNTGMLYLYPPSDPDKSAIEIGMLSTPMITMENVSHVRIEAIDFDLARYNCIAATNCSNCTFVDCTVSRMAGNGIMIQGGNQNKIIACHIHSLGRRATEVIGGDRQTLTPGGHLVENCRIHDFGRIDRTYTPAIQLEGVGNRVAHNLMYNGPSSAMRIEGNDHLIEYNEVHDMVRESDDQGAMELFGNPTYRGVVFRHNYLHHIGKTGTELSVHGQAGIRFDDAISDMLVYGNVFYRCSNGNFGAVQMNGGRDNLIDNNIFIDCKYGISGGWYHSNNIWKSLKAGQKDPRYIQNDLYLSRYPKIATMLDDSGINHLWRNVFYKCDTVASRTADIDQFENSVFENDPGFVNAAGGNFNLKSNAKLFETMCFKPIPFDRIGLYEN